MLNQAAEQPEKASRAYDLAILFREALYRVFSNRYAERPIAESDLTVLNSVIREAMAGLELVPEGGEFHWEWAPGMDGINPILWPVARAARCSPPTRPHVRVRTTGAVYLFIDQSKNHSRRWCSMEGCGNRAKARRHYSRIQAS
jgi:predicted RNA-binding Zn ribbon-like protein